MAIIYCRVRMLPLLLIAHKTQQDDFCSWREKSCEGTKEMKSKNKSTTLKFVIVTEIIVLILICGGFTFVAVKSDSFLPRMLLPSITATSAKPEPIASTDIQTPITTEQNTELGIDAPIQEFNLSKANQGIPDDILEEIAYFAGGLGGGDDCTPSDIPFAVSIPDQIEWMKGFGMSSCGWKSKEAISVKVINPSGEVELYDQATTAEFTSFPMALGYYYEPSLLSQVGMYQFVFEGESGKAIGTTEVYLPSEPRLYRISNPDALILYGFSPYEKLRLLAYDVILDETGVNLAGHLIGWSEYQVNEKGQLVITLSVSEYFYFVAVGENSGVVAETVFGLGLQSDVFR